MSVQSLTVVAAPPEFWHQPSEEIGKFLLSDLIHKITEIQAKCNLFFIIIEIYFNWVPAMIKLILR